MLDSGLAGKTCLITGGSTGIGLGIARALAREGVHLAVASRNPDPQAMGELRKLSGGAIALRADVSTEGGAVQMVYILLNASRVAVKTSPARPPQPRATLTIAGRMSRPCRV